MLFKNFKAKTHDEVDKYLRIISDLDRQGELNLHGRYILYPNIILFTQCNGFYVAELIGSSLTYEGLTIKRNKVKSIYRYLSQFEDKKPEFASLKLDTFNIGITDAMFNSGISIESLKSRFPFVPFRFTGFNCSRPDKGLSLIRFGKNFRSCFLNNCVFINSDKNRIRIKPILSAFIFRNNIKNKELYSQFKHLINHEEVMCVNSALNSDYEKIHKVGQLQGLYYSANIHETTIGEYLSKHPDLIYSAFDTNVFIYEPTLKWIEHDGTCEDQAINPDLFIRRKDGYYDLIDLKKAKLEKTNLTTGPRKRRRPKYDVLDGITQLGNYEEYFNYPKNRQFAEDKYGIKIKDPKLILVIGTWDNVDAEEMDQALRAIKNNYEILDYDTFCGMMIGYE